MSRSEWAIERLRYWLAKQKSGECWSGGEGSDGGLPWSEGVCILAGIDPELSLYSSPKRHSATVTRRLHSASHLWFLPGGLAAYGFVSFPRERDDLDSLWDEVTRRINLLYGLGGKSGLQTAGPHDWLSRVTKFPALAPPWLDAARDDPICSDLLPTTLQSKSTRKWMKHSAKGGSIRPEAEVLSLFICDALREGRTSAEVFRLFKKHVAAWNLRPGASTVRRWCNTLLKDTSADELLDSAGNPPDEVARLKADAMRMLADKSLNRLTSAR